MTKIIDDTIIFGIGVNNEWDTIKKTGTPELKDISLTDLIPENFTIISSNLKAIVKVIGDGNGKYGISLTSKIDNNPITYCIIILSHLQLLARYNFLSYPVFRWDYSIVSSLPVQ